MKEVFDIVNRKRGDDSRPEPMQVIVCGDCSREDALSAKGGRAGRDHVAGTFTQRGWIVGDVGKHLCPDCQVKRRAERASTRISRQEKVSMNKVDRSPAAAQRIGELYMILSDAYDVPSKNYKAGWSDQRIAKDTGLAVEFVAKRREDDFGPIVVDTSFEDAATEIGALTAKLAVMRTQSEQQRERLVEVEGHAAKVSSLLKRIVANSPKQGA